jgi:Peptidase family M41/C-terminal, D2-small domain, of ClpB protein
MNSTSKEILDAKRSLLTNATKQLKKEFIGIDGIIDELADAILPWWLFPENQMRPLIINLWGMTGSGKTALIKRLSMLLSYENYLLRFDMGEFGASSSFLKYSLTRQLIQFSGTSPIIVLDEFQFAKTKDEQGKEVNNTSLRIIWDLLDSGELLYEPDGSTYYLTKAKKVVQILTSAKKNGVQITNGIVKNNVKEMYDTITAFNFGYQDSSVDRSEGKVPYKDEEILLTDVFCTGIYEMNDSSFTDYREVVAHIKTLPDIQSVIDFIKGILEEQYAFKKMDLTHSLIFVVGNLDEAFSMSNNINPDIDADEFRRFTLKINISDIKTALQSRFRNEQIARLGNNHLIYHAFSHKNFEQLINMHLKLIAETAKKKFKLKIQFTQAVKDMLYSEGVFPTQGVRPIISTIRNLVESNITKIILHIAEENLQNVDTLNWDFANEAFEIGFVRNGKTISKKSFVVLQKINSLRKSNRSDLQAIVAVHEAGHAVAAMMFAKVLPEYVITRTVDSESNGFAYILLPEEIITYRLLKDKIRIGLGGYLAEALIFGTENNTTGVSADLQTLTQLAHQIVREFGMTGDPFKMNIHQYGGNSNQFTFTAEHEKLAQQIIQDCRKEVQVCFEEHKKLIIIIAKYLSNNSRLDKELLRNMANEYFKKNKIKPIQFTDIDGYYDFRKKVDLLKA